MSDETVFMDAGERLYVLYGSETGNAESIAKRLHHDATNNHGFPDAACMTLNQAVSMKLFDAQLAEDAPASLCVVIVCSTTGEGEPPQNAARFRRWLRNAAGTLHKLRYCLLALGDTNYNSFCAPGIFMDNKLRDMGAVCCYPRGEADDNVGLHLVVNPWLEGLWSALKQSGTEGIAATGQETCATEDIRIDMSVAQEAALLYSNSSPLCAATALFLHERITELGGKADLYPIQHFNPTTSLRRPPTVLFFVLGTEGDADAQCEQCACAAQQLPPLGPLSAWIGNSDPCTPPPAEAVELHRWMSDPSIRFFNSLFVSRKPDGASRAAALDADLKALATNCKLEYLCRCQLSGEVPSVAISADDVFLWVEKVLHSLPGVTADTVYIRRTMDDSFDTRVGAAFRAAHAPGLRSGSATESDYVARGGSAPTLIGQRLYRVGLEDDCGRGDAGHASSENGGSHGAGASRKTHEVVDDLLTPIVFLYSGHSSFVKQCAMNIFSGSGQHHLRCSISELSNFQRMGFPRHATFVFIVSGVLTEPMSRVLKVLRTLQSQKKDIEGVSFAILGIGKTSESGRFNACALELETLLLKVKANKIHCTGLADVDSSSLVPIVQSWESSLWGAIVRPMKSTAYLDIASPGIQVQRSVAPLATSGSSVGAALCLAGALVGESVIRDAGGNGGVGGGNDLVEHSKFGDFLSASASPSLLPLPGGVGPSRGADMQGSSLVTVPGSSLPGNSSTPTTVAAGATPGSDKTDASAAGAGLADALSPWDTTPLHREKARHTPVVFLYASAGMSKAIAMHAMRSAEEKGFPTAVHPFAHFQFVDYHAHPNVMLFCEAGAEGQTNGGRRFRKFLTNPSHHPGTLSSVRFAVLGLCATPADVVHPAFCWAKLLLRLQANRIFPVLIMPSISQLHSLGMPWINCVLSSLALLPSSVVVPSPPRGPNAPGAGELTIGPSRVGTAAAPRARDDDADNDAVEEAADAGEEVQRSVSADMGSCGADVSTEQDSCTEWSMENRIAYRVDGVVQSWKLLTCPTVRHPVVQLDFSVSMGTQWAPGQTIAVVPSNSTAQVEALLRLFHLTRDEPFLPPAIAGPGVSVFPTSPLYEAVDFPVSCGTVLMRYVELRVTGIHKPLFELLARPCASEEAKAAVQTMYAELLADRTPRDLCEVLEAVGAAAHSLPPFRHIVENLSLLQPRQYSICSSHRADATTLSICFKVVEKGLCTRWMYEQCLSAAGLPLVSVASAAPTHAEGCTAPSAVRQPFLSNTAIVAKVRVVIPFEIRSASVFRMPRDPLVPMILVGSGTGIAPFRAFLQEREACLTERQLPSGCTCPKGKLCGCSCEKATRHGQAVCGTIDVFFGCRRRYEDYLFRDELSHWKDSGVVHSLAVAFSRDTNDGRFYGGGCYVQDKIQECGVALMDLILQRNAYVFVCGDADGMAKEVHRTLRQLIQQHLTLSDAAAATYLERMSKDGRYLREVWSTGV
ncbi:methionine synthase reductase, mitochondrial precursor-like protein [Leishmania infantum JPCM5]|uniref:NADPH--hemoprotein reductase n=2 Tax=Leishmania infantum TaxID=5671 RepID=A0A6L0XSU4_LEIIN|nr:methionine synthase reductase, mitochondrial precursor-like protein [Leishmania infantum JPCM5]CAC9552084.1 methionine_synthase_reductase_-_mitochondrial_precursor-like_protein [Leishmania infantum]CAM72983.1 methionine synthase reductase, mitochondrial precursor-like protein [Leishmania infantum JPCM5]SUZ46875.1 methionine_synthase_reductase_-_mitochondrial_precursor-like_protein [Leishmania infantum]|eukprot:XP_001469869.1 methionine synthase reductase, mitochondrial precursor-like protein [Leishmania infantum JPCM5]